MKILTWLGKGITDHEPGPPCERIRRDYEWQDNAYCFGCRRPARHTYIEWLPELVTTRECHLCNLETEVARELPVPEETPRERSS